MADPRCVTWHGWASIAPEVAGPPSTAVPNRQYVRTVQWLERFLSFADMQTLLTAVGGTGCTLTLTSKQNGCAPCFHTYPLHRVEIDMSEANSLARIARAIQAERMPSPLDNLTPAAIARDIRSNRQKRERALMWLVVEAMPKALSRVTVLALDPTPAPLLVRIIDKLREQGFEVVARDASEATVEDLTAEVFVCLLTIIVPETVEEDYVDKFHARAANVPEADTATPEEGT